MIREIRDFVAEQWWRFLIGIQILTLVNFVLLVITASDKLKSFFGIQYTAELVLLFIPLALLGIWLTGFVLERYIRFPQAQERAATSRSPTWNRNFKMLEKIEKRLVRIEKKINV
ncbi:MAG: hypothetical protein ACPL06_03600 [Candidatus Anstonellales archaeon]